MTARKGPCAVTSREAMLQDPSEIVFVHVES